MNLDKFADAVKVNVVGLGRSGQHGIVNWLFQQFDCSLFLNNYHAPSTYDAVWFKREKILGAFRSDIGMKPSVLGYGLEGSIERVRKNENLSVIVVRDIKNHVASLVKHPTLRPNWDEFFEDWIKYASFALETYELQNKTVTVLFPNWAVDEKYRKEVARFFKWRTDLDRFSYTDKGKESVMGSGGGSSFDKQKFDGKASQMDVLNRWQGVNLPAIPSEVLKLNDYLFPEIYEWRG